MATVIKNGLECAAFSLAGSIAGSMAESFDRFADVGNTLGAINGGVHFATAKAIEADRKPLIVQLSLPLVTCAATTLLSKAVLSSQEHQGYLGVYVFSATALSVVTLAKFLFQKLRNALPVVKDESYLMRLFNYSVVSVAAFLPSNMVTAAFVPVFDTFNLGQEVIAVTLGLIYGVVQITAHKLCGSSKESLITKIASQVIGPFLILATVSKLTPDAAKVRPFVIITGVSVVSGAVATLAMHYFKGSSKKEEATEKNRDELISMRNGQGMGDGFVARRIRWAESSSKSA